MFILVLVIGLDHGRMARNSFVASKSTTSRYQSCSMRESFSAGTSLFKMAMPRTSASCRGSLPDRRPSALMAYTADERPVRSPTSTSWKGTLLWSRGCLAVDVADGCLEADGGWTGSKDGRRPCKGGMTTQTKLHGTQVSKARMTG